MSEAKKPFKSDLLKFYLIELDTAEPSAAQKIRLWVQDFALHCVAVYRFGQFSRRLFHKNILLGLPFMFVYKIINFFVSMIYHINIDAEIGPGFYIAHVGTIYIGPCRIGENFSVTHNVTIGVGHTKGNEGIPTIGNNVWVGTGSVISGAVTIGDGVTVTNGCMLSRSVPDGALVGGNPGRVIMREYDNKDLLVWSPDR